MAWKQRGNARNITEVIKGISRLTMEEIAMPEDIRAENIMGMEEAANLIRKSIWEKLPIMIVGDYDVDGITSTSILWFMFRHLGVDVRMRLPRRYTEGYGLSVKALEQMDEGLLITVDNGIAAVEPIKYAKEKGLRVLVLDHHLPGKELPMADVIVDPHIAPEQSDFSEYCGAGLAYKLSQMLIDDHIFLKKMCALAAIGTIADVVPLIGDNRVIAKKGLDYINKREVPVGLLALMNAVGLQSIDEQAVGFIIGPLINAAGRLEDRGAEQPLRLLTEVDYEQAEQQAYALIEMNEKRKLLLKEGMQRAHEILKRDQMEESNPICIYDPELLSGLAGLVAGRLAEEYRTPALVLSSAGTEGMLKGSGRTSGGVHLKYLLDEAEEYLQNYGGHEKAVGLGLKEEKLPVFRDKLEQLLKEYRRTEETDYFYDLEVKAEDIPQIVDDLKKYAPFGEGNPRPIVRVDGILLLPQAGKLYRLIGEEKEHIRLLGKDFSVVGFHKTEEYICQGEPDMINVIGYISHSNFRRKNQTEIEAIVFEKYIRQEKQETELQQKMMQHFIQFADLGGDRKGGSDK